MMKLSAQQQADFFRRCYTAVDGLWFVKLEGKLGFKKALAVDREVWKVFPKIQARALKALGKKGAGLEALAECFTAKLKLEGFTFKIKRQKNSAVISISGCPWHDVLVKAGRGHRSRAISQAICKTEYGVWAQEFGPGIAFTMGKRLCCGARACRVEFGSKKDVLTKTQRHKV
jgi:hypothetical protein